MSALDIHLFGKFQVRQNDSLLLGLEAQKPQELFGYLLLLRDRPHPREHLASLLWCESSSAQSKKYLRQALWQLQAALESVLEVEAEPVLIMEADWIRINPSAAINLDVARFETGHNLLRGKAGHELDVVGAKLLEEAVQLYRGDLLEGWYHDWCLYERERLQNMCLSLLDKLIDYYEANREYEAGLLYADKLLRFDRARERTHRRLMRLYYLAGDRTAALRQYERCLMALEKDLGVEPSQRTVNLYEQIRTDTFVPIKPPQKSGEKIAGADLHIREVSDRLRDIQTALDEFQGRVQHDVWNIEQALMGRH